MSTRANIIIRDGDSELIFYRHSDGYPEGILPTLEKFLQWVIDGKISDNVGQASGWLILIGMEEYSRYNNPITTIKVTPKLYESNTISKVSPTNWKCGTYEPTYCIHGDIEYLYVIDLEEKKIFVDRQDEFEYKGKYRS